MGTAQSSAEKIDAQKESEGPVSNFDIRSQLDKIISRASFRNSKRYPRFLQFVVNQFLLGGSDDLKERVIGIEVFDRPHDYDTTTDPIVRVAAGEIRKRLAQYYVQAGHEKELRLEFPSGSYRPVFHWPATVQDAQPEGHPRKAADTLNLPAFREPPPSALPGDGEALPKMWRRFRYPALVAAALVLLLAGIAVKVQSIRQRKGNELRSFWEPVFSSGTGTTVCIGDTNKLVMGSGADGKPLDTGFNPSNFVAPNDMIALTRVNALIGREGQHISVLVADSTNLNDLRAQPAVLIGAYNNPWTLRILGDARFRFAKDSRYGSIVDRDHPEQNEWHVDHSVPLSSVQRDYALVTRLKSPLTGQTEMVLAGISLYGTAAASEFLTNPEYFHEFAAKAPVGWERKELQIVLRTDIVDGRSGPPKMITFEVY